MRRKSIGVLSVLCFASLAVVIFQMIRIASTPTYEKAALQQTQKEQTLFVGRGDFSDRNGIPFKQTQTLYYYLADPCLVTPQALKASGLPFTQKQLADAQHAFLPPVCQTKLAFDIGDAKGWQQAQVSSANPADTTAQHLLGSLQQGVGISGLEKTFNAFLKEGGDRLSLSYLANAKGGVQQGTTPKLLQTSHQGGVVLTLNRQVQQLCEKALADYKNPSAAVVMDVRTGEILAMASYPNFDPQNPAASLTDKQSPFLNRCLQSYDAGSIFKIVTTAAALEQGITPKAMDICNGFYQSGQTKIACSNTHGHGNITLKEAFASSCNPYFCQLGQKVGGSALLALAKSLGLGRYTQLVPTTPFSPTPLADTGGKLPSLATLKEEAALALFAFGQGQLQVTPVQMASVVATVANQGVYHAPSLVLGVKDADGHLDGSAFPQAAGVQVLSKNTCQTLLDLLANAVSDGSGSFAASDLVTVGGKTGSAETGWQADGEMQVHGWFVGCLPAQNPKWSVVVFCENGKSGALAAAPIFKQIAEGLWLTNS